MEALTELRENKVWGKSRVLLERVKPELSLGQPYRKSVSRTDVWAGEMWEPGEYKSLLKPWDGINSPSMGMVLTEEGVGD